VGSIAKYVQINAIGPNTKTLHIITNTFMRW